MSDSKIALITAASRGIGAGCARSMAADGWSLVLMSRSDACDALAAELGATAVRGSIDCAKDLERAVAETVDQHGRLDAVVANCGHLPVGDLLSLTDEQWHYALDMVQLSVMRLARIAVPAMRRTGGGSITCISGAAAREVMPAYPMSTVLRAGLRAFVRLAAREWAPDVRVNAVLPGFVETFDVPEDIVAQIPMDRPAQPEEIGALVTWLSSDAASYVTGESICADGGLTRAV